MPHWLDKIVDIFDADTTDLRELARIAGGDPKTFYQFTSIDGVDIRRQNLVGMRFYIPPTHKGHIPPPIDPKIQEAAEAKAAELLKQNKPVPDAIALNVRQLDLMNSEFTDAALLTKIKWLQIIDLSGTKIANFTPLRHLTHLISLDIQNTKITDLNPISGLEKLQRLYLSGTEVSDLNPISGLETLQTLYLRSTQVTDWTPVAHVKHVYGRPEDWDQ